MLSVGQRARLLAAFPVTLDYTPVNVQRRDRFLNPINGYPSVRLSITSQGIRMPNTSIGNVIRKSRTGWQGDVEQWIGGLYRGGMSVLIEVASEKSGTDLVAQDELDRLTWAAQIAIDTYGLGLYYPIDHIKVIPGSCRVIQLPEFFIKDEFVHQWIYRNVIDFQFMYEFSVIDPTPNIHAIDFDFGVPTSEPIKHYTLAKTHPPWYGMNILLKGCAHRQLMDIAIQRNNRNSGYGMSIRLVNES